MDGYNGESCEWCMNEDNCKYKRNYMEATRDIIKNLAAITPAYCSIRITCDYYVKDNKKYIERNIPDLNG